MDYCLVVCVGILQLPSSLASKGCYSTLLLPCLRLFNCFPHFHSLGNGKIHFCELKPRWVSVYHSIPGAQDGVLSLWSRSQGLNFPGHFQEKIISAESYGDKQPQKSPCFHHPLEENRGTSSQVSCAWLTGQCISFPGHSQAHAEGEESKPICLLVFSRLEVSISGNPVFQVKMISVFA